jgi:geranylgeranyl diphosphate synthase type I
MDHTIVELLNPYRKRILDELKASLTDNYSKWDTILFDPSTLRKALEQFMTSGKLIRGSLLCFSYEMFSNKKVDPIAVRLAVSLEWIHTALLIHDDIMDRDITRRGVPTVHHCYTLEAQKQKSDDPATLGNNLGLCVGDLCYFTAYDILSRLKLKEGIKNQIMSSISQEFQKVLLAQMNDVRLAAESKKISEEEIISVYRFKTARYTFSLPILLGGMLAGIPDKTLKLWNQIGEYYGILYQLRDDELGSFGNEKQTGKTIGGDIRINKKTLIHSLMYKNSTKEEIDTYDHIYGNSDITQDQIDYLRIRYAKSGSQKEYQSIMELTR